MPGGADRAVYRGPSSAEAYNNVGGLRDAKTVGSRDPSGSSGDQELARNNLAWALNTNASNDLE